MAASAAVLYAGTDRRCHIPVMRQAGLIVSRAECTIEGIHKALNQDRTFSAVTFPGDEGSQFSDVVGVARSLVKVPFVLFEGPSPTPYGRAFDIVIPFDATPSLWLEYLRTAMEDARKVKDLSRELRAESTSLRRASEVIRTGLGKKWITPASPPVDTETAITTGAVHQRIAEQFKRIVDSIGRLTVRTRLEGTRVYLREAVETERVAFSTVAQDGSKPFQVFRGVLLSGIESWSDDSLDQRLYDSADFSVQALLNAPAGRDPESDT